MRMWAMGLAAGPCLPSFVEGPGGADMSSESEADVSEVLERWSKAMPSVGLRWEACPDSDDGYAVLIGRGNIGSSTTVHTFVSGS